MSRAAGLDPFRALLENMAVDAPKQNRLPRILILAVTVALLFVLAVGGYAWWITRPLSGTLAVPVARRGGTLLTAQARHPVLPENEMAFMPGILRIVSRMHRFTIH